MKKLLVIAIILSFTILLTACGSQNHDGFAGYDEIETRFISASFPVYESIEHLSNNSTDIIRVIVLEERSEFINTWLPPENELEDTGMGSYDAYFLFTVHRLEVVETFKGYAVQGDIIEIKQFGGQADGLRIVYLDAAPLSYGDDLILFLRDHGAEGIPTVLTNPLQSAYRFAPLGEGMRSLDADSELESINAQNDLTLTINDLIHITNLFGHIQSND